MFARQQVVLHQGAGRFAADNDIVAFFQVLQARGERAIRNLDAEKFQVFFPVGADDAVGADQRAIVDFQTDHDELAVVKAQSRVASRGETE